MAHIDTYDFANEYGVDPWGDITTNERQWYDPVLRDVYSRASVYSQFATFKIDLAGGARARTITFNDIIPPRANIAPIANRTMQATRLYTDAVQRDVTVQRYGNGMALHRESSMFDYWTKGGQYGLLPIIQDSLGQVVTDHCDYLARNAFFLHPYPSFGIAGVSSVGSLNPSTDKISTAVLDSVWLGMRDRSMPFRPIGQAFPTGDELICITTSGVAHDLKTEVGTGTGGLNFVEAHKYGVDHALITGELGMYRGVRFVESQMAKLWNVGTVTHQTPIKVALKPGDGAPDPATTKVEGSKRVGQPGAVHYVQVTDAGSWKQGDMLTVHLAVHDSSSLIAHNQVGVVGGVVFDDPMQQTLEVHSVNKLSSPHQIVFKEPYMMTQDNGDGLETDLGGTVFGYVTQGQTVHSALFINPNLTGIVCGVAQPPVIYTPPAIDDYMSMFRITYDMWLKYAMWEARAYELRFFVGANRGISGPVYY